MSSSDLTNREDAVRWGVDPILIGASVAWLGPSRRRAMVARLVALALTCSCAIALVWPGVLPLRPGETLGEMVLLAVVLPAFVTLVAVLLSRPLGWLFAGAPIQPSLATRSREVAVLLSERIMRSSGGWLTRDGWVWLLVSVVLAVALFPVWLRVTGPVAVAIALLAHLTAFVRWTGRLSIVVVPLEREGSDSPLELPDLGLEPPPVLRIGERVYTDPFGGYPRAILALASNPDARQRLVESGVPDASLPPA